MEYLCLKQSMSERTVERNGRMRQKLLAMALPIKPMTFTKYYIYMNMKSGWFDEYVKWFVISINNISIFFFLLHRLFLDSFVDCWFPSNSSSSGFFLRCDCINCIRFVSWHSTYFARVFFVVIRSWTDVLYRVYNLCATLDMTEIHYSNNFMHNYYCSRYLTLSYTEITERWTIFLILFDIRQVSFRWISPIFLLLRIDCSTYDLMMWSFSQTIATQALERCTKQKTKETVRTTLL